MNKRYMPNFYQNNVRCINGTIGVRAGISLALAVIVLLFGVDAMFQHQDGSFMFEASNQSGENTYFNLKICVTAVQNTFLLF